MTLTTKSLLTDLLPPVLVRGLGFVSGRRNRWKGNYPTWASAVAASSGYDTDAIFKTVRKAASAVRDGLALWERDGMCFYQEEYNWNLIACLMTVAARSRGMLNVMDFGGALGSTYMQHRHLLEDLPNCSWGVIEQPHVVACGRSEFATERLQFWNNIEQCLSVTPVNAVLFSSVLQYLENPYELLEYVVTRTSAAIIIDRTPMSDIGERITVQHVPPTIYPATYPCRFLDRARVESILRRSRTLTPWFTSPVDPPNFFGAMSSAPTAQ